MQRVVLLLALAGCGGIGFDGDPEPNTPEECAKSGGTVRREGALWLCDLPPSADYAAAQGARVSSGDAGAHD